MQRPGPRAVVLFASLALVIAAVPAVAGAAGDAPPDPDEDTIGWENGYWYNESVDVTREDGLNDTELEAVVARGMARVEQIRGLEFEKTVPVEVISRETYREQLSGNLDNTSEEQHMHTKVVLEAMLTLGESESARQAQESTLGSGVLGQYKPGEEAIQIVSENASTPKMNEITLSQELFHALQDQHFDIGNISANTTDGHNANDGVIEGDGNYVDLLYQRRCEDDWDCLLPTESAGGGGGGDIHFGLQLTLFQPYSDGPPFVKAVRAESGWAGVDALYDRLPESSEQVIHPEKYPDEEPVEVDFEDTSGEAWRILDVPNQSVDYDTVGEGGMAVMLLYPFFDSNRTERGDYIRAFVNQENRDLDPYDYSFNGTDGWGGDRIYPYVRDDSVETNETGYVWKTVWDSRGDAVDFWGEYEQLLSYYGAEAVPDRLDTFRIPDSEDLGDAFYVNISGRTVTIVNAPSVEELDAVRAGAAPAGESSTPTPTTTTSAGDGSGDGSEGSDGSAGDDGANGTPTPTDTTADGSGPGLGVVATLLALVLASAGLAARRQA